MVATEGQKFYYEGIFGEHKISILYAVDFVVKKVLKSYFELVRRSRFML